MSRNALRYTLFFILLLILNFFFYSLLSIAVYKIICNETTYNYLLDNYNYFNKQLNIYILCDKIAHIYILDSTKYSQSIHTLVDYTFKELSMPNVFYLGVHLAIYTLGSLYTFDDMLLIDKYVNLDIIQLSFYIRSSNLNIVSAWALQKVLIVNLNETSLLFFRVYNPTHLKLELITLYIVYPNDMSVYVNKIQCFCFNVLYIYPLELLDLPVLIYIVSYVPYIFILNVNIVTHIIIYYVVFMH